LHGEALATAGTRQGAGWGLPLLAVIIGSFMSILDSTIVNVAIPTLQSTFGASTDQVQWVVTIFLLALGVVVPVSGWLADRYGLTRVYIASLIIFTAGSALCGLSTSLAELVFFRLLQGIGGGLLAPITMAMVYRLVPRDRIGTAMGLYGLTIAFGPALGPTLGGYLVQYVDWRLIFYINVPIGIFAVIAASRVLHASPTDRNQKLDPWGSWASPWPRPCYPPSPATANGRSMPGASSRRPLGWGSCSMPSARGRAGAGRRRPPC
jgi:EmrB/QacA subfamily drug resistance transporter